LRPRSQGPRAGLAAWLLVLACALAPAHAQDPDPDEPDGTSGQARVLAVDPDLRLKTIAPAGDVDWLRVTLEQARLYEIGAVPTPPGYGTPRTGPRLRIDFYDRNGTTLLLSRTATQRGQVVGFEVRLTRDFPGRPGGDYFLRISALDQTTGAYGVSAAAFENDGTRASAAGISLGAIPQIHVVATFEDEDYQKVYLVPGSLYQIEAYPDAAARVQVALLSPTGAFIDSAESLDNGTPAELLVSLMGTEGLHYLQVSSVGPNTGAYAIRVIDPFAPDPGYAVGRVISSVGGAPIADAAVLLRRDDGSNGLISGDPSAADGGFELQALIEGNYLLSARKDGYVDSASVPVFVPAGGFSTPVELTLVPEVTTTAPDAANTRLLGTPGASGATIASDVRTNGGDTRVEFRFQRTGAGPFALFEQQQLADAPAPQTASTALADLDCGATYQVQVTASNSVGSDTDAGAPFNTMACPPAPPRLESLLATPNADLTTTFSVGVATNGSATTLVFEYRSLPSGDWIALPSQNVPDAGGVQPRSATTPALACGSDFQFRATASNAAGTAADGPYAFRSFACPPTIASPNATAITPFGATAGATANTSGIDGLARFEFRREADPGWTPATIVPLGASDAGQAVSTVLGGLGCATAHRFRVRAETAAGTSAWAEAPFTTGTCPPASVVSVGNAPPGLFQVVLNARIASNGLPFTATFEYRQQGTTPYTASSAQTRAATPAQQDVFQTIELRCGQIWEYRVSVSNAGGVVRSFPVSTLVMPVCGDFLMGSGFEG
jgi:hypothetical protein